MSVNKVILIGNVGKDPEIRYFDNGSAVANFTVATTERGYTAANGTQVPDRTEWHNVVCWRGLAKIAEQFVKKGTSIYIEGKIRTRNYDDNNGVKRYVTEIYVDNLELLSRKRDGESDTSYGNAPTTGYPAPSNAPASPSNYPSSDPFSSSGSSDDDLPF